MCWWYFICQGGGIWPHAQVGLTYETPKKIWHRPMTFVHAAILVAPALVPWGQGSWGGWGASRSKTNLFASWCSSWRSPCSPRNWWRHSVDLGPDGKVTCQLWKCQRLVDFCVISGRLSHHHCPIKMVDCASSVTTQNVWFITLPKNLQYQKEKRWAANQRFCSMKFSMYKRSSFVERHFSF